MFTIRTLTGAFTVATILTIVPGQIQAQERNEAVALEWQETMEPGSRLHLFNINGGITVEAASGNRVEVVAHKRWTRGDPELVRVEARRTAGGNAIVCAFWSADATCDEDGYSRIRTRNDRNNRNDVSVHYTVRLPAGVHVTSNTVNGGITIADVTGEINAETVNGSIKAESAGGPVRATTVNGSIEATMGSSPRDDIRYETVNGAITITVPADFSANLALRTTNGSIRSDFPITVQGRINPRRLDAQLGEGGPRVEASTVNGSVRLVRN